MESKEFTYSELVYNLKVDKDLTIVFVEGNRDLSFWRKICPISQRINSVVYSAEVIDIDCGVGGNKGRLIKLAKKMTEEGLDNRVKVFVDADYDHITNKVYPSNVICTDWKDIESYALDEDTIDELIRTGLAKHLNARHTLKQLCRASYPIGIMRIVSEVQSLKLPFNKTFEKNGRKKILKKNKDVIEVNVSSLIDRLLQNADISLMKRDEVMNQYIESCKSHNDTDSRYILHGKDWGYYLAHLCDVELEQVEPLIFLSMDYDKISKANNISFIKDYLSSDNTQYIPNNTFQAGV